MPDMGNILKKQSDWQRGRAKLSWAEKLRQSIVLRDAQRLMKNRVQESKGKYSSGMEGSAPSEPSSR